MRPSFWQQPVELSRAEEQIAAQVRRAKLFVFLRHHRHELFDEALQQELASLYRPSKRGRPPTAPAQLALAVILQAYTGVSDDEVIEATLMDRRWQLVLDCLDADQPPFSKGTFAAFRKRLIDAQIDRRLIEQTIELASQTQEFGSRALRAALDSSPLCLRDAQRDFSSSTMCHQRRFSPNLGIDTLTRIKRDARSCWSYPLTLPLQERVQSF